MPTTRPATPAKISVSEPSGKVRIGSRVIGRGLASAIALTPIGGLRPEHKWTLSNG